MCGALADLKSVVLHDMKITHVKSNFPVALGARITGVDDATYSQTGEAYSTVALPATDVHTSRTLQEEDTALGQSCFEPCRASCLAFLSSRSSRLRKNCFKYVAPSTSFMVAAFALARSNHLARLVSVARLRTSGV